MKIVYNWLKEFVDVASAPADLRTRLSLAGVAIDSIDETAAGPVLDAEVTANRPDCLGHYGVAREVAAIYRLPQKPVNPKLKEIGEKVSSAAHVEIEARDLCGRFTARVMRGVKIGPSPAWLRDRLEAIGENSINNVVDVTNYIMFELGHPLHAFDFDRVAEHRVLVRRARAGEKLRTLDGVERTLDKDMCVVADSSRALSIAGVMGGAESEISSATRNVLIECAWFDPISVRRTSKSLGLRSEASYRFERGADPEMAELASRRAAELIQQVAGGEILSGVVDVYPGREAQKTIELARKELLRVMGSDVPDREVEEILGALGFHPVRVDTNRGSSGSLMARWECRSASWRRDVTRGIDLIEEVARHYGYDKFPPRLPPAKRPAQRLPHAEALDRLRERIIALGYQEIVEIPLVNAERDALFRPEGIAAAKIGNPLAEDASVMRSTGTVSMLGALEWNLNHGQRNLRLFEMGKAYELRDGQPVETAALTLGCTGLARGKSISEIGRPLEFCDLKGDLDSIGALADGLAWTAQGPPWLHSAAGLSAQLALPQREGASAWAVGVAGQLAPEIARRFKFRQDVFVAELHLERLLQAIEGAQAARRFVALPRFPAVERDFSVVLPEEFTFGQIEEAIQALGIAELQSVRPADRITHAQARELAHEQKNPALAELVPAGKYSLMIRVAFQSAQTTLTDAQIAEYSAHIMARLEHDFGAILRAS
ncbi:MAG: phenylalanine--tRNA ligase subunit beta [Candidatus Acidiferrales bacterium]